MDKAMIWDVNQFAAYWSTGAFLGRIQNVEVVVKGLEDTLIVVDGEAAVKGLEGTLIVVDVEVTVKGLEDTLIVVDGEAAVKGLEE